MGGLIFIKGRVFFFFVIVHHQPACFNNVFTNKGKVAEAASFAEVPGGSESLPTRIDRSNSVLFLLIGTSRRRLSDIDTGVKVYLSTRYALHWKEQATQTKGSCEICLPTYRNARLQGNLPLSCWGIIVKCSDTTRHVFARKIAKQ